MEAAAPEGCLIMGWGELTMGMGMGLYLGWFIRGLAKRMDLRNKCRVCRHETGTWTVDEKGVPYCTHCARDGKDGHA